MCVNARFFIGAALLAVGMLMLITLAGFGVPADHPVYWISLAFQTIGSIAACTGMGRQH